jgi:hypothetical protein
MACPTCDHIMNQLGIDGQFNWCPRCGTIKRGRDVFFPRLIGRIIEFAGKLTDEHQELINEFELLGIRECITIGPNGS